jgi:plastocyanin
VNAFGRHIARPLAVLAAAALLAACSGGSAGNQEARPKRAGADRDASDGPRGSAAGSRPARATAAPARRVDPRRGGLGIDLGEWALTPEARVIRPGPVTFVIRNRGTMAHGFEIALEGDSSGPGSGDLFKSESELLRPGEALRMQVALSPGVYKIECLVDGHDDMGMEGFLEVRANAPLVKPPRARSGHVAITGFAFTPPRIEVTRGTRVTWRNDDPTAHTVTSDGDVFDSGTLDAGATYAIRFERAGVYPYRCLIHPEMRGAVKVE